MTTTAEARNDQRVRMTLRGYCFDLLDQFFKRAIADDNIDQMRKIFDALVLIHRGQSCH